MKTKRFLANINASVDCMRAAVSWMDTSKPLPSGCPDVVFIQTYLLYMSFHFLDTAKKELHK